MSGSVVLESKPRVFRNVAEPSASVSYSRSASRGSSLVTIGTVFHLLWLLAMHACLWHHFSGKHFGFPSKKAILETRRSSFFTHPAAPVSLLLPDAFLLIQRAKSFLHFPSHLPGSRGQWWVDLSCHPLVFASCRPRALVVALSWSEDWRTQKVDAR